MRMKIIKFLILISLISLLCCNLVNAQGWQQKQFITYVWCPPPATAANMTSMTKDNYSLVNVEFWDDPTGPLMDPTKKLDIVGNAGMKALLFSLLIKPETLDNPTQKAKLDQLIDKAKNHAAMQAYYIADEPQAFTFKNWARLVKYIKERDPEHLAYINLYPIYANQQQLGVELKTIPTGSVGIPDNYAGAGTNEDTVKYYNEYLRQYIEIIKPEMISYDHYHFMANGIDGQQYFLNLAIIRQAALIAGVPFMNIVQSSKFDPSWRMPTAGEMRWQAFTTLAYGGRGLGWFVYWGTNANSAIIRDGVRSPNADSVASINRDTVVIGNELLKMTSTAVYHTGKLPIYTQTIPVNSPVQTSKNDLIIGLFKQNGIQNTFMVMNRNYKQVSAAKITLYYGSGKLMEFSSSQNKWIDVQHIQSGSSFTTVLNPGDGKLFRVINT